MSQKNINRAKKEKSVDLEDGHESGLRHFDLSDLPHPLLALLLLLKKLALTGDITAVAFRGADTCRRHNGPPRQQRRAYRTKGRVHA